MQLFFVILTIMLVAVIVIQLTELRSAKSRHKRNMELLQKIVEDLYVNAQRKNEQLQLSTDLFESLRNANMKLTQDVSKLVTDFVETLSENNLVK